MNERLQSKYGAQSKYEVVNIYPRMNGMTIQYRIGRLDRQLQNVDAIQIGRFLNVLGGKFLLQKEPKIFGECFGYFEKGHFESKTAQSNFRGNFVKKIGQLFTSASSHTELTFSIMWLDPSPLNKLDQHLLSSSQLIKLSQGLCPYLSLYPISHN